MEVDTDLEFASTHPVHPTRYPKSTKKNQISTKQVPKRSTYHIPTQTRQANLSDQLASALAIRLDCGCDRLDCNRDPNVRLDQFKEYLRVTNK